MRQLEHNLQVACVNWFNLQYPMLRGLLFAVPNGQQRNKIVAAKLKAEGVIAGVADLLLVVPRNGFGCLCVELKTQKGKQRDTQKEWEEKAKAAGNMYVVCRAVDEFKEIVTTYLNETDYTTRR